MKTKLIDLKKEGTVILTHYRSGGTQLRSMIDTLLDCLKVKFTNIGELDFDTFSDVEFFEQIDVLFSKTNEYKLIQLNNPLVIAFLQSNDKLKEITKRYHVVHLERENKRKCLLSLGVWEEFIHLGLFTDNKKWTLKAMKDFDQKMIDKKLDHRHISLGFHHNMSINPKELYLANTLMYFTQILELTKSIKLRYNLVSVIYEEYEEFNLSFFNKYFGEYNNKDLKHRILSSYNHKIPYYNPNFSVYFSKYVNNLLDQWGID